MKRLILQTDGSSDEIDGIYFPDKYVEYTFHEDVTWGDMLGTFFEALRGIGYLTDFDDDRAVEAVEELQREALRKYK